MNFYSLHLHFFVRASLANLILIEALGLFFLGSIATVYGQEEKSPTVQFLNKRGYNFLDTTSTQNIPANGNKWPDTLYYNTVYKARLLGSPTVLFSFSKTEWNNGTFQVSPSLSIGLGYAWFLGDFIFNENDKITVDQNVSFGLLGDVGLQNNLSLKKLGSIFTGGFVGIGPLSLSFGYDYLSQSFSVELGQRIDLYTLSQNFLNPIGKVREARGHKSTALRITNE